MTFRMQLILLNVPKPFLGIIILIFINLSPAISQSLKKEAANHPDLSTYIQKKHGFDQELIKGIQYYNPYYNVQHHPYYDEEKLLPGFIVLSGEKYNDVQSGFIVLSGKKYNDVQFNYDLYGQYLILEYQGVSGGINKIIVSPAHTDAFQLDGNYFEKLILNEQEYLFYQVIRVQSITCYIHWEKLLMDTQINYKRIKYFTDPRRNYYLDIDGKVYPFKNRKTFASLFSGDSKKDIKSYMRQNEIYLSDVTTEKLAGLLEFVSSRLEFKSEN